MGTEIEDTSVTESTETDIENVNKRKKVDSATFTKMLSIPDDLLDHDHYFSDTYGTACNCQCECNCQCRGVM